MVAPLPSGPTFVGRAEVVEALYQKLEKVREGGSAVTLLVGDAGVGKSTLVSELVPYLRGQGVRVLLGRASVLGDPSPLRLLQAAIESARDDPLLRDDIDPQLGGPPMIMGFLPGLGERVLPTPMGVEGRLLEALGGIDRRGGLTRDEALAGIADRFLELTRHGPTALILEDLPRADPASVAAVEFFARELQSRPLWILATTRPAPSLSAAGRERLEKFESNTRAERVVLRPLTSGETAEFLQRTDPSSDVSSEEIARRFSETGGNPYLLQQLSVRTSSREEVGTEARDRTSPPGPEDREVLDLAAVLGPQLPFPLLLAASGIDEERLAETVDRLVARGLLLERPGELLEFPDDRTLETAYASLPERRRRALHRRAGETLEAFGPADAARTFALARHFYLARDPARSVRYNRVAAEIAERALAPEVAWENLSHALESQRELQPEEPEQEADLVLGLARVTEELGLLPEAEETLRDALQRDQERPRLSRARRATLELLLSLVLMSEGKVPLAAQLAEKVLDTPGLDDQPLIRLGGHHQLGLANYYTGHFAEALAHHTTETGLAREVGNPLILLRARIWRVANLAMLGETQKAIAEARELTLERDRLGSARESAQAHLFLGDILADARSPRSDRDDAVGEYEAAIRYAEKAKDPRRVGWAHYKTSELLRETGRLDDAFDRAQLACHILAQVGDQAGLSVSLKARGQVAMSRGDLDGAEADFVQALGHLRGTRQSLYEIDVVLRLAQVAVARGNLEGAREYSTELEHLDLPRLRPDLATEFEALRRKVTGTPGAGTSGSG
jgi:tetratricopeptide (TPR) repeat protein